MISASLVLYNNPIYQIEKVIETCLSCNKLNKLIIVNNGEPISSIKSERVQLIENEENIGFGKAHNLALREVLSSSDYHLVLNPDIVFRSDVLDALLSYMNDSPNVGLVMPKILNMDGSIQYNCKLLPTPLNLFIRRFLYFIPSLRQWNNFQYEMQFSDYNAIQEVPVLSGCFMLFRVSALRQIGLFDPQFFLYVEDVDISRRMHQKYQTIYYPKVFVYHQHEKGSYKSLRLMWYNIISAIRYFNKWGWWFDKERTLVNAKIKEVCYQNEISYSVKAKPSK